MACVIVPAVEAVVTTVAAKVMKSREKESEIARVKLDGAAVEETGKISFSRKLGWLSNMLWGGSALLTFEHIWHGEIVPLFPFLTAMGNPADAMEMLREMATAGVGMSVLVTGVWLCILAVVSAIEKRAIKPRSAEQ